MTLKEEIFNFKIQFVTNLYETMGFIARKCFDYPNVPGMRIKPKAEEYRALVDYVKGLPVHQTRCPPPPAPATLTDVLFGNIPQFEKITRTFYQHKYDGFYNIQIPDYRNIWFLPDWLSKWIQVNLEITVDVSPLEHLQQAIFIAITMYYFVVEFRVKLFWFLTINPYTRPWVYLLSLTDWIMDWVNGLAPTVFSIDISPMVVLGIFGKAGDALNHLVFTMPFLPSEGTLGNVMVNGKVKHVILYRYLPSLWAQQPIPDKLREFWYTQRPDILKYMKKNYSQLDIDFEPNRILEEMYDKARSKEEIKQLYEERMRQVYEGSLKPFRMMKGLFNRNKDEPLPLFDGSNELEALIDADKDTERRILAKIIPGQDRIIEELLKEDVFHPVIVPKEIDPIDYRVRIISSSPEYIKKRIMDDDGLRQDLLHCDKFVIDRIKNVEDIYEHMLLKILWSDRDMRRMVLNSPDDAYEELLTTNNDTIIKLLTSDKDAVEQILYCDKDIRRTILHIHKDAFVKLIDSDKDVLEKILHADRFVLDMVLHRDKSIFAELVNADKDIVEKVLHSDYEVLDKIVHADKYVFEMLLNSDKDLVEKVLNSDKNIIQKIINSDKDVIETILNLAPDGNILEQVLNSDRDSLETLLQSDKTIIDRVLNAREDALEKILHTDKDIVYNILHCRTFAFERIFTAEIPAFDKLLRTDKDELKKLLNDSTDRELCQLYHPHKLLMAAIRKDKRLLVEKIAHADEEKRALIFIKLNEIGDRDMHKRDEIVKKIERIERTKQKFIAKSDQYKELTLRNLEAEKHANSDVVDKIMNSSEDEQRKLLRNIFASGNDDVIEKIMSKHYYDKKRMLDTIFYRDIDSNYYGPRTKRSLADGDGTRISDRFRGGNAEPMTGPEFPGENLEPIPGFPDVDIYENVDHSNENSLDILSHIKQFSSNVICDISSSSHHSVDHFVSDHKHLISELLN
jgi:uncharacterized protein YggT (Ycf19 family)